MIRQLCTLLMLLYFVAPARANHPTVDDFMGVWRINKNVGYADMSGGLPTAQDLMGKVIRISPKELIVAIDKVGCIPNSGFHVKKVDTAKFLEDEAGATVHDAKLPANVFILDSENCISVFWLDRDHIEIDYLGVFVVATREKQASTGL